MRAMITHKHGFCRPNGDERRAQLVEFTFVSARNERAEIAFVD
jgi:hypothetical protein